MGLIQKYVDTVRKETGMFAIYPPNQRVELGDFGKVSDGRFVRHGNIKNLQKPITVQEVRGSQQMNREFKSRRVRKTAISAGASGSSSGVTGRARLELDFGAEDSVYFAVAGCTHKQLGNLGGIANEIIARSKASTWNDDYRIVTALIESANTTLVLGREESSKVVLEAGAGVSSINMTDAELSLELTFDSAASENWVTMKSERNHPPFTPFCWFHYVDRDLFGYKPTFDPTAEGLAAPPAPEPSFVAMDKDPLEGWNRR